MKIHLAKLEGLTFAQEVVLASEAQREINKLLKELRMASISRSYWKMKYKEAPKCRCQRR